VSGITNSSPRILYISEPWTHGGPQIRYLNVLRALQQIGTVEVVTLGDADGVVTPQEVKHTHAYETEARPNVGLISKIKFTFDPRTDYPYGLAVSAEGIRQVLRRRKEFDLIWFFKQRAADVFPAMAWQRSVVDIDDVQSTYDRAALRVGDSLDRLKALRSLFIWRRRERLLTTRFSVLTVCSEVDRKYLERIGVGVPIHVIPNGFERSNLDPVRSPVTPPRIGFIGAFDHLPNREGITWFVKKCWPAVRRSVPHARLRLIGRYSNSLGELDGADIDCLGWLPNPSDEIRTWLAMIVPIRLGAGTRVKIAQGFSEKCPIISTSLGALGYGATDGIDMFLADSAEAFSRACVKAICEPEEAARMAERAWTEFLNKWTWDAIRPRVLEAVEDCLGSAPIGQGKNTAEAF
jgi:glycosyltransferase involved in cell wall biosynthesis